MLQPRKLIYYYGCSVLNDRSLKINLKSVSTAAVCSNCRAVHEVSQPPRYHHQLQPGFMNENRLVATQQQRYDRSRSSSKTIRNSSASVALCILPDQLDCWKGGLTSSAQCSPSQAAKLPPETGTSTDLVDQLAAGCTVFNKYTIWSDPSVWSRSPSPTATDTDHTRERSNRIYKQQRKLVAAVLWIIGERAHINCVVQWEKVLACGTYI